MADYLKLCFILILLVLYFQFGYSMDCYRCVGDTGSACDKFNKNHPDVQLKHCGDPDYGYRCIQFSERIKNHRRVERGCVLLKKNDFNPCIEKIAIEVSRLDYKTLSCSMCTIGNGCNHEIPNELL